MEQIHKLAPDKRSAVLQAGIEEFSQHSFTDANTDTITQSAGISKGLLFHYFGSKKQFYLFCLDTALSRLISNTPESQANDFFDMLFFSMDEKICLCRDFPKETLFVNLSARDASEAISAEKQVIYAQYMQKTASASQQLLCRAVSLLPLKAPQDTRLIEALYLYIHAINQKYLLQYRETPEQFLENAPQIQREMRTYLNYMLEGILQKQEAK